MEYFSGKLQLGELQQNQKLDLRSYAFRTDLCTERLGEEYFRLPYPAAKSDFIRYAARSLVSQVRLLAVKLRDQTGGLLICLIDFNRS